MPKELTKIGEMMQGKTLEKDNIKKMYQMVQDASGQEEQKAVMKHSVFFVGQLPLKENHVVDVPALDRCINLTVPLDQVEEYRDNLLEGLSTQKLLLKKDNGDYEVNTKYEKSVLKVRKIAKAYRMEKEDELAANLPKAKKMYQAGTKYYHDGRYEEAAACFMNTIELAEYRMGYYSLAMMYFEGKGVEPSKDKALYYARHAVVKGAVIAQALEEEILNSLS